MTNNQRKKVVSIVAGFRSQDDVEWIDDGKYAIWTGRNNSITVNGYTGEVFVQDAPASEDLITELDQKLMYLIDRIIEFFNTLKE